MPRSPTYDEALKLLGKVTEDEKELRKLKADLLRIVAGHQDMEIANRVSGRRPGRPRHAPGSLSREILDLVNADKDVRWTAEMMESVLPLDCNRQSISNVFNRLKNDGAVTQVDRGEFQANGGKEARRIRRQKKNLSPPGPKRKKGTRASS